MSIFQGRSICVLSSAARPKHKGNFFQHTEFSAFKYSFSFSIKSIWCPILCHHFAFPSSDFQRLSLDKNTADRNLGVSEDHRGAELVREKLPYPDHPDRFDGCKQVLSAESLSRRCYWEVQWAGVVAVGVACGAIQRSGAWEACCLGRSDQSWSVLCSAQGYTAWHGNRQLAAVPPPPGDCRKMGVYLDCAAGALSFYCFPSSAQYFHVHTFHAAFTEPLYAAVGFEGVQEQQRFLWWLQSSVRLCDAED